jgi:hypothetical protein
MRTAFSLAILFLLSNLLIALLASTFVPYLGFYPYKEIVEAFNSPAIFKNLASFDGAQYLVISSQRYYTFAQAYFPFYPMLIRVLAPIFGKNHLITALLISNVTFIIGFIYFLKYAALILKNKNHVLLTGLLLLAFPSSFYFSTVYTESLFFMFLILGLFQMKKGRYLWAFIFAYCAGLTRLVGLFIVIPFFVHSLFVVYSKRSQEKNTHPRIVPNMLTISFVKDYFAYIVRHPDLLLAVLAPILGVFTYSMYLLYTYGDGLYFFHAQSSFGANRSGSHLIILPQVVYRYLKIFITAQWNFQYFMAMVEFGIFHLVFFALCFEWFEMWRKKITENLDMRIGMNLFSFANLILPTLTGTFSSIPRYAIMSISFFFIVGELKNDLIKLLLTTLFITLHIILFAFFIQGYFVG